MFCRCDVWFNLVLGIGTQCMTQGAGCGCSGHLRWPFPPSSLFSRAGHWAAPLSLSLVAGGSLWISSLIAGRLAGAAAFFGAGVCYLSGLFSSPGPGEGGVVSGELLALAFGSGCFGWLRVWVWVCCFQLCSPGRSSRGRTSELLCWAGGMVPGELLALAFWLQLASCWGSSLCL